jgi:hypothetical protein
LEGGRGENDMFKFGQTKIASYKAIAIDAAIKAAAPDKNQSERSLKAARAKLRKRWPAHEVLAAQLQASESSIIAACVYDQYKNRRDLDPKVILALVMDIASQGSIQRMRAGSRVYNKTLEELLQEDAQRQSEVILPTIAMVAIAVVVIVVILKAFGLF